MSDGRAFLLSQVRAAEERHADAIRAFNEAASILETSEADLLAFQRALEAFTRETDSPYHPAPIVSPLDALLKQRSEGETASKDAGNSSPKLPKITKIGIALNILERAAHNGRGAKFKDVLAALPPDLPIKITRYDLYRALAKLQAQEKAWRDREGYYHAGRKPEGADVERGEKQDEQLPLAG